MANRRPIMMKQRFAIAVRIKDSLHRPLSVEEQKPCRNFLQFVLCMKEKPGFRFGRFSKRKL